MPNIIRFFGHDSIIVGVGRTNTMGKYVLRIRCISIVIVRFIRLIPLFAK